MDVTYESNGSTPLVVRVPTDLLGRIDTLAYSAGMSRSQLVRFILGRFKDEDIPSTLFEIAENLRPLRHAAA
jgi:hypothetical protein